MADARVILIRHGFSHTGKTDLTNGEREPVTQSRLERASDLNGSSRSVDATWRPLTERRPPFLAPIKP